ncbi:hypothetical protein PFISCL1PPCAC_13371, partial [Pristionchus fissidentatus]
KKKKKRKSAEEMRREEKERQAESDGLIKQLLTLPSDSLEDYEAQFVMLQKIHGHDKEDTPAVPDVVDDEREEGEAAFDGSDVNEVGEVFEETESDEGEEAVEETDGNSSHQLGGVDDGQQMEEETAGKRGNTKGAAKKKKNRDVPQTEEEMISEIGKWKEESFEKAMMRMKMRTEAKVRKMEEEEKRRKREKEERKKRETETVGKSKIEAPSRNRADACRRTKELLQLGKRMVVQLADDDEGGKGKKKRRDEEKEENDVKDAKPKKVTTKKRVSTKPVTLRKKGKKDDVTQEEGGDDCGNYTINPNDVRGMDYCQSAPDSEYEDEEEGDDELPLPFLWRSDKESEMMMDGAMGPASIDSDEALKIRLNELTELSEAMSTEYRAMMKTMDGLKLNLFGDSTIRRFDPRVMHSIDFTTTECLWPVDMLPNGGGAKIPTMESQMWPGDGEYDDALGDRSKVACQPFTRIRSEITKKNKKASRDIDAMASGGGGGKVTNDDILKNLDELLLSKLDPTKSWTPLPSSYNPFDIPEITSRKQSAEQRVDEAPSYVQKTAVMELPRDRVNNKKMTIKEALVAFVRKPAGADAAENIYKDEGEGEDDGYQFEWNEMGDVIDNPMRGDPFGAHPYEERVDVGEECEEEIEVNGDDASMMETASMSLEEEEKETQIGEAFSFMANNIDA